MQVTIKVGEKNYLCRLDKPIDLSIAIYDKKSPLAFYAPLPEFNPFTSGDFVGSIESGSPVNFYDIKINPHGNGTHTETNLHIDKSGKTINSVLHKSHFISYLLCAKVELLDNGDRVINKNTLDLDRIKDLPVEALIIRTEGVDESDKYKNYTNTNPIYLDPELVESIPENINHLLIDLPSVDKEKDDGMLLSHKAFWNKSISSKSTRTITELIYVEQELEEGFYFLNIQTLPLELDVSPSRPIIFRLEEE